MSLCSQAVQHTSAQTGATSICSCPTSKPSLVWSWGTRKTPAQLTRQFKGRPVFLNSSAKSWMDLQEQPAAHAGPVSSIA